MIRISRSRRADLAELRRLGELLDERVVLDDLLVEGLEVELQVVVRLRPGAHLRRSENTVLQ